MVVGEYDSVLHATAISGKDTLMPTLVPASGIESMVTEAPMWRACCSSMLHQAEPRADSWPSPRQSPCRCR